MVGDGTLLSVAYSPDGRWPATWGGRVLLRDARTRVATGEFRFWRVTTGAQVTSVRQAEALAWNFAFLPGAQDFVGACAQPQLVRGTLGSDPFRRVGAVHPPGINAVATGPGVLVSAGGDDRVLVSPLPGLSPLRRAVNPQGTLLAVGDVRGTVD